MKGGAVARAAQLACWLAGALALGCGEGGTADDADTVHEIERADAGARRMRATGVELARPEHGVQVTTRGRTIAVGADEEWCEVVALPGDDDQRFFVGRTELAMTPFSHHLIVSIAPEGSASLTAEPLGTPERCNGGTHRFGSDLLPLAASALPYTSQAYPDGVGLTVHGGQRLLFNYHALNTGDVPFTVQHRLNLHFVDAIEKPARKFGFYNQYIAIPPHTARSFGDECRFKDELLIWSLARHTHRFGTDFRVYWAGGEHDGELLWTSRDWEQDITHAFDPPVVVPADAGFRWECDFQNPTDEPLAFGPLASDEMCILFGDFAAAGDDSEVGPQSCYRFAPSQ